MKLTVLPSAPPAGLHKMQLTNCKQVEGNWGKPALQWFFDNTEEPHRGCQVTRTTAAELKLGGSLAKLIGELLGEDPEVGSEVDLTQFVGKVYDVLLVEGNGNGVVISRITPVDA